jgi:hypothetical protein
MGLGLLTGPLRNLLALLQVELRVRKRKMGNKWMLKKKTSDENNFYGVRGNNLNLTWVF